MKSGYKVFWTKNAIKELERTFEYIALSFSEKELINLSLEIEKVINIIAINPQIFPVSDIKYIRRAVILRLNTLYYRIIDDRVEILSFFSNRKNPENRKLEDNK